MNILERNPLIQRPKILYVNCTAVAPHIGCLAVTDFQISTLLRAGFDITDIVFSNFPWSSLWRGNRAESVAACLNSSLGKRIREVDILVVNGEGTLHHAPGMGMLVLMTTALQMGKKVHLVNTSITAVDRFDDVLADVDDLNVRENMSSKYLTDRSISHRVVLDSLLGASFSTVPDRDLSGKTIVMDWHPNRDKDVGRAIVKLHNELSENIKYFLPLNHYSHVASWRHTVANLRPVELVVTGRYHGVYLAGLAGCPFVALPSNTDKVQGLIERSGLPIPFCNNYRQLRETVTKAKKNPSVFDEFRCFLDEQIPLSTFKSIVEVSTPYLERTVEDAAIEIEKIESKIAVARLEEQYRSLFSKISTRAELTPKKEIIQLARRACLKLRGFGR